MESIGFFAGIISLTSLIVFFIMASNLGSIKKDLKAIRNTIHLNALKDGILWTCHSCSTENPHTKIICKGCGVERKTENS